MEEIDIIELFRRVKEGKAPKCIEIDDTHYEFYENYETLEEMYNEVEFDVLWHIEDITLNTKIKILDKPIIEELEMSTDDEKAILIREDGRTYSLRMIDIEIIDKINEIIKHINKEEK